MVAFVTLKVGDLLFASLGQCWAGQGREGGGTSVGLSVLGCWVETAVVTS